MSAASTGSQDASSLNSGNFGSVRAKAKLDSLRKQQRSPPLRKFGATELTASLSEESSPKPAASNPLTEGSERAICGNMSPFTVRGRDLSSTGIRSVEYSALGARRTAKKRGTPNAPPQLVQMTSRRMLTTLTRSVSNQASIAECFADKGPQATPKTLANTKFLSKKRMQDWISSGKLTPSPKGGQPPLSKTNSSKHNIYDGIAGGDWGTQNNFPKAQR